MPDLTLVRNVTEKDFDFSRSPKFVENGQYAIAGTEGNGDVRVFAVHPGASGNEVSFPKENFEALFQQDRTNSKLFHSKNTGKRARVNFDATYTESTGNSNRTVQVKEGGFLFKSDLNGSVAFYTAEDFIRELDRILCDGTRVSLQEPWDVQMRKSRAAGDRDHGLDLLEDGGLKAVDKGTQAMKDLWNWASSTETGQETRRVAHELRTESTKMIGELKDAGREAVGGITEKAGKLFGAVRRRTDDVLYGKQKAGPNNPKQG